MNKEMNKTMKTISLGAAVIAAGAVYAGGTAHAEEVIPTNEPNTQVTENQATNHTTEADVKQAEEKVSEAKTEVSNAEKAVSEAEKNVNDANNIISEVNSDIEVAKQADKIVAEKTAEIENKTAELDEVQKEKQDVDKAVENTKASYESAKSNKDDADQNVQNKESDVASKQEALDKLVNNDTAKEIMDAQKEVADAKDKVAESEKEIDKANADVTTKEKALADYTPTVKTTIVNPDVKSYVDNHPTNIDDYGINTNRYSDYKYEGNKIIGSNPRMESVNFNGFKTIEVEITKEQYEHFKATGEFDYVVDNQKLAEAFVKLLNEVRALNGMRSDLVVDPEFQTYAEFRANEMVKNDKMSHATINEMSAGSENISQSYAKRVRIENGKTIITMYETTTHESFAYKLLLGWYSDYNNVTGNNYGHRRALLKPTSPKIGLAMSGVVGDNVNIYTSFNTQWFTPEYEIYDGEKYIKDTPEYNEYKNIDFNEDDKLNPTLNGQKMKFIAERNYIFTVKETVEDQTEALTKALNEAKAKRDALVAAKPALESDVITKEAKLADVNVNAEKTANEITKAQAEFDNAKAELDQVKADATEKANAFEVAKSTLNDAKAKVDSTREKVENLQKEISNAQGDLDKAQTLKDKLPELETKLAEAKQNKAVAEENKAQADDALVKAQAKLADAESNYKQIKSMYDLEQSLKELEKQKELDKQRELEKQNESKNEVKPTEPSNKPEDKIKSDAKPNVEVNESEVRHINTDDYFVQSSENRLPNTGMASGIGSGIAGLFGLVGAAGLSRKRRNK